MARHTVTRTTTQQIISARNYQPSVVLRPSLVQHSHVEEVGSVITAKVCMDLMFPVTFALLCVYVLGFISLSMTG